MSTVVYLFLFVFSLLNQSDMQLFTKMAAVKKKKKRMVYIWLTHTSIGYLNVIKKNNCQFNSKSEQC